MVFKRVWDTPDSRSLESLKNMVNTLSSIILIIMDPLLMYNKVQ